MWDIDKEIRFHLVKQGWYIEDIPIEIEETHVGKFPIVVGRITNNSGACFTGEKIILSEALAKFATGPQRRLAILHEYAHSIIENTMSPHELEYACDAWALKQMFKTDLYTYAELQNAIAFFRDIVYEPESYTPPASEDRYRVLMTLLKDLRKRSK